MNELPDKKEQLTEEDVYGLISDAFTNFTERARIQKGYFQTGAASNAGGMATASQAADIIFWAGATWASRASAPFRVDAAGNLTASAVSISGVPVTSQGTFGGNGSDGALSIASGTTTINLGGEAIVVKNYTSISITGTGKLAFSNPHANGTIIILKSQGNVTLTSSTAPHLDASGMGGAGGAAGSTGNGTAGTTASSILDTSNHHGAAGLFAGTGGAGGAALSNTFLYTATSALLYRRALLIAAGSGGGGGSAGGTPDANSGAGGNGGGGLLIECNGALNFTTTGGISVNGIAGQNGSADGGTVNAGGGGGGSAGMFIGLYKTVTANTGTITNAGGAGGNGFNGSSGQGGGGGAGSFAGAGGAGGNAGANGAAGAAAGAGGGGGAANAGGTTGGAAGGSSSNTAFWAQNAYFA